MLATLPVSTCMCQHAFANMFSNPLMTSCTAHQHALSEEEKKDFTCLRLVSVPDLM